MTYDLVATMISHLRNAALHKAKVVEIRATATTRSIAQLLLVEGWIKSLVELHTQPQHTLVLGLKYSGRRRQPAITQMTQLSKPGLRLYAKSHQIPHILGGIGLVIVSTSQGIMTDRQARQNHLGGELLCSLW